MNSEIEAVTNVKFMMKLAWKSDDIIMMLYLKTPGDKA